MTMFQKRSRSAGGNEAALVKIAKSVGANKAKRSAKFDQVLGIVVLNEVVTGQADIFVVLGSWT